MRLSKIYQPTASLLNDLLQSTGQKRIIVLGAGNGGGILDVLPDLSKDSEILLTDLFPMKAFHNSDSRIKYFEDSVNAFEIPPHLAGIRVMYTTFHHFDPTQAHHLLEAVVQSQQPIAIFEASERSLIGLLLALLVPLAVLIFTPFTRPFRLRNLLWTYIIPVIPIGALWDGVISTFRTYTVSEMTKMVADFPEFEWDVRTLKGPHHERVFSLTGKPRS